MYGHKVKVWGEDLIATADLSSTSAVESTKPILAGGTNGGLIVRAFALDGVVVDGNVNILLSAAPTKEGPFEEVATGKLKVGEYNADEIVGEVSLPVEPQDTDKTPMWYKASVVGNSSSSGSIRVAPGILAR